MDVLNMERQRKKSVIHSTEADFLKYVIKIQNAYRRYKLHRTLKKKIKMKKSKQFIAMELLTSQRTYCQHLRLIVQQVMNPSKSLIQDEQLHSMLFTNIEQIYKMHAHFLSKFEEVMANYNHHSTKISEVLLGQLFNNNQFKLQYSGYCSNYRNSNKIAKLLVANNIGLHQLLKKVGINESSVFESYLIKPMQRLCKYELILNNYLKNTETTHCDYENVEQAIIHVQKLVRETNDEVEEFLLNEKFRQVQSEHESLLMKIPNSNRKLLLSMDEISLINLIDDQSSLQKQIVLFTDSVLLIRNNSKHIFNPLYKIRDLPNLKYFKNIVQLINDDQYLTVEFKKEKQKQQFMDAVKKTEFYGKNNSFVDVKILGTESRQSLFKNYTVYIAEVQFGCKTKNIYPRFKDLLRIQQVIEKKKIRLNLPSLSKETVFATGKSKTIQKRKLIIQEFLEKIFNCHECYSIEEIFKILQMKLTEDEKKNEEEIIIHLPSLQIIKVLIDVKNLKVCDLKEAVNQNLGLINSSQFQIFEIRNKVRRLMHDHEPVSQIYLEQKSFNFNPFKDSVIYIYTRHHHLEPEQELSLYKNDFVRTELELSVIKAQIRQYRIEEELMITFMCLFAMYINLPVEDDTKLSNFIKQIGKKEYKISIEQFKTYYKEVEKRVQAEEDEMATIPFLIITIMNNNSSLYMCQQFEVSIHPKSFKAVKTYISGLEEKIILGVKRTHLLFLTSESKHLIQSFLIETVQIAEIHPTAIILQIELIGPNLRLNTQHAYQISRLLQIYKQKK